MEEKKNQAMPEETAAPEAEVKKDSKKEDKKCKGSKKSELEAEVKTLQESLAAERESHLRLAAEYDNFRKRTTKEKDASYGNGKSDAIAKILPIYDNLDRALMQPTEDEAFKKGVELTMTELMKIFTSLGIEVFGQTGDAFDPNLHNAVMHVDDESLGENVLAQVFQKGFKMGERVIRFAMVQVAN